MNRTRLISAGILLGCACLNGAAFAVLPPPSPGQAQAAAAKKAQADAQAQKEKQELIDTMDAVAARWRSRASAQGLKVNPPVAVAAPPAATTTPLTGAAPAGQPEGRMTATAQAAPIRSEKLGTAPPSEDVKKGPTKAEPAGAPPTVIKR
jgi:hypothetical protein